MEDKVLALAGIFQAAELVYQIARHGRCDEQDLTASVGSILKLDAATTPEIYDGIAGVRTGLRVFLRELGGDTRTRQLEVLRYALGVVILEKRLRKRPDMLRVIRQGVERATLQAEHFSLTHPNVLANLAGLYSDTLSTFSYRIQVLGEPSHLQNPNNVNKVRTLLLAGVRSAVLWRQKGGKRWQLLLSRRTLLQTAETLLRQAG